MKSGASCYARAPQSARGGVLLPKAVIMGAGAIEGVHDYVQQCFACTITLKTVPKGALKELGGCQQKVGEASQRVAGQQEPYISDVSLCIKHNNQNSIWMPSCTGSPNPPQSTPPRALAHVVIVW